MVQLTHNGLIFNDFGLYVPIIPIVCTMSPAKGHGIQEVSGSVPLISTKLQPTGWSLLFLKLCGESVRSGHPGRGCPYGAAKVCHPERRAKPEVEGSSHRMAPVQMVSAKILRLAALAQDDRLGLRPPLCKDAKRTGTKREHGIARAAGPWQSCGFCWDYQW